MTKFSFSIATMALMATMTGCVIEKSTAVLITDITINPVGDVFVEMGRTVTLTATVTPPEASSENIIWSTYHTYIATIDAQTGVVTGVNMGTATIRASATDKSGVTAEKNVTVSFFSQGNGTQENPYVITTPAQMDAVRDRLHAHYKLGNNINLTSYLAAGGTGYVKWGNAGWEPIGRNSATPFTGSFDGAGYKITGLWENRPSFGSSIYNGGLFGCIENATIKNLGVDISNAQGGIKGFGFVGGIVGLAIGNSKIDNCYTNGAVSLPEGGSVGGVVGEIWKGGSITNCYATGTVSGNGGSVGGVVGAVSNIDDTKSSIVNCYAMGNVICTNGAGGSSVGGVAGRVSHCDITNCFATGNITCTITALLSFDYSCGSSVGGLVGWMVGWNNSHITDCFATGNISSSITCSDNGLSHSSHAGGIAGVIDNVSMTNCYATGTVASAINVSGAEYRGESCAGGIAADFYRGSMTNCVALNPSVKTTGYSYPYAGTGRVIGYTYDATLHNNWGRNNTIVTQNNVSKTLIKGSNQVDGADCIAIPAQSWWTTAAPNGPEWSTTVWTFTIDPLPKLQQQ